MIYKQHQTYSDNKTEHYMQNNQIKDRLRLRTSNLMPSMTRFYLLILLADSTYLHPLIDSQYSRNLQPY